MRHALCLLTALAALAGCSRADLDEGKIPAPTAIGSVERIDRLQYLGNASSALVRAEDAWRHQKPSAKDLAEAVRLVDLAHRSAQAGNTPVEASWEGQLRDAIEAVRTGMEENNASKVDDALDKAKLYLDQAQQAASIEY